jgi:D-alanine-D-alanine ligase
MQVDNKIDGLNLKSIVDNVVVMKKKILLIFGGRSSEHEVSFNSAKNIFKAVDKTKFDMVLAGISKEGTWYSLSEEQLMATSAVNDSDYNKNQCVALVSYLGKPTLIEMESQTRQVIDVVFPIIHGTNGEDGTLQGLLKMANVPFVGCDVLSSAVCMDKEFMKQALTAGGVSNSKYMVLHRTAKTSFAEITKTLGLPFFIKPANAGSSVGVHKVKSESDFADKVKDSFLYDHKVIAEEFIQGQELECSVKGLNANPQASVAGELIVKHEFYSYEAKYLDENGAEILIPARISGDKMKELQAMAIKAYQVTGCDGLARVDFFLQSDGKLIVNELNTLPGFTKISMYPKMWEATGLKYSDLITELVKFAFEKFELDSTKKQNYINS